MNEFVKGDAVDTRPDSEKARDWKASDMFGASSQEWKEVGQWMPDYSLRNQDGSSMCMAFSLAKHLGINNARETGEFIDLSPVFIYRQRANAPAEGMWLQNVLEIGVKSGSPKDSWLPSDDKSEGWANKSPEPSQAVKDEALLYRGKGYVQTDAYSIDQIAQAIDVAGSCIIRVACNAREWTKEPFADPSVPESDWNVRHGVVATQYGTVGGKRFIKVEDSWGSRHGKNGARFLSEDFVSKRMRGGGYVIDLDNPKIVKLKYKFSTDLRRARSYSKDVAYLQKILILEGCMSEADVALFPGYFGPKTEDGVKRFQLKYAQEILAPLGLKSPTGIVGASTRKKLNSLYW